MPKRFRIKGSGKLVEYAKDATSKTGYRRIISDEDRIEELKKEIAQLEEMRAMPKTTDPKSSLPAIPQPQSNPEIFKRLGMVNPQFSNQELEEMEMRRTEEEAGLSTMGKSLTGLSKEEMNNLDPLALFGMLPVGVSKGIVLNPERTGVMVARDPWREKYAIDNLPKMNPRHKEWYEGMTHDEKEDHYHHWVEHEKRYDYAQHLYDSGKLGSTRRGRNSIAHGKFHGLIMNIDDDMKADKIGKYEWKGGDNMELKTYTIGGKRLRIPKKMTTKAVSAKDYKSRVWWAGKASGEPAPF